MSRIGSVNTTPELIVRKLAHHLGLRYRLHRRDLPGTPDLVFPKRRTALFVHGCFWHQHQGCSRARTPITRTEYWGPKLTRNVERDKEAKVRLESLGWRVIEVWECETRDLPAAEGKLRCYFGV